MARYRTYKNGITGHHYKGYYIIRGEAKGEYAIWNSDKSVFKEGILDYDECEWMLDKITADAKTLKILKDLYQMEIFELSAELVTLMQKKHQNGVLDEQDKAFYKWVIKVRKRKVENRAF